jgi:riboflavin biosynthesis pyrimidine reductase
MAGPRLTWHRQREGRFPFGPRSPAPDEMEAIGFPPPWPDRPWIFANMVASADGVVAWRRAGPGDDPVLAVLGGDHLRPERIADRRHMRHLRCFGDVGIGAETLRQQPELVQTPREPGEPPAPELYGFRVAHGLPREPRHVIYTRSGRLDPDWPVFRADGVEAIALTTEPGAAALDRAGVTGRGVHVIADALDDPEGLRRAHRRLFAERGVRYLDCEGGDTVLRALHAAGLLDEIFVTVTDVVVDRARHAGVLEIFDFEREGAILIAEGGISEGSPWRFRRWRFNPR